MIHLVAIVVAKPGQRAELLAALQANRPAVLAERGCLEYTPLLDAADTADALGADAILIVERWASEAALDAHRRAPHMAEYREHTSGMVQTRTLHLLTEA
jgi:quinol monooxygenase YgiN